MSVVIPAHLVAGATRALAESALPDAAVEPDRAPSRARVLLRTLFRRATTPTRIRLRTEPTACVAN